LTVVCNLVYFVGDGKTLILEYKEGNSACSHTKRRSDNTAAKVIIKFECGNTVGGPVYGYFSNICDHCNLELVTSYSKLLLNRGGHILPIDIT
jgi:hypothetical protein